MGIASESVALVPLGPREVGSGFKEMTFELELSGGRARVEHIAWVLDHPSMTVRVESLQARGDAVWEVAFVTGPTADVRGLLEILRRPAAQPVGSVDVAEQDPRSLRWIIRWDRPRPEAVPSLFHLVFDIAGPDALVMPRIAHGRIEVRVACREADDLGRLFRTVQAVYGARFDVRLLRVGNVRGGQPEVPEEDRDLLAKAIAAGYYDEPKRVGVRELGEVLGWSKTVISRRLRALERRAVERLASE